MSQKGRPIRSFKINITVAEEEPDIFRLTAWVDDQDKSIMAFLVPYHMTEQAIGYLASRQLEKELERRATIEV